MRFGFEGEVQSFRGAMPNETETKQLYAVGVKRGGKFLVLGVGLSWEDAFRGVKECQFPVDKPKTPDV